MIQYVLWAISFVTLWLTLVWLNVLFTEKPSKQKNRLSRLPRVTLVIPCYNKAPYLRKTVTSLMNLDYPKKLLNIIIVNDGSKDATGSIAENLKKEFKSAPIKVIHQKNKGKAGALNAALARTNTKLFACLDADTRVHPESLRYVVPYFADQKMGGVITTVKVDEARNLYEKVQRAEYVMFNFFKRLMSALNTIFLTPGVLSVFRTSNLRRLGGFQEGGLTEDLEIAMRLQANGYDIRMEPRAITYTAVPSSFKALWKQRIRWYRGFIFNHLKYRGLFFKKNHGLFGTFQLPVNVLSVILLLITVLLVSYGTLHDLAEFVTRSLTIKGYFINHVLDIPSLRELVLAQNVQITLPIFVAAALGIYVIFLAHKLFGESLLRHAHFVWLYFLVSPYLTSLHWLVSIAQEALRFKRKW